MRCFLLNRLIKIIVLPFLFILNLNAQDQLSIQNEEFMPLHTRILWGEKGLIRKMNLAPETRRAELKLRTKMLQNQRQSQVSYTFDAEYSAHAILDSPEISKINNFFESIKSLLADISNSFKSLF